MSDWRLAVDIGGTFTDVVLLDAASTTIVVEKVLTTAKEPAAGVMDGVRRALARAGVPARTVRYVIHGTTLVTNALIERKGAVTGLITTAGHEDAIEIGRETRYDAYDLALEKPEPLVPPPLRLGLSARLMADGSERVPLRLDEVDGLVARLRAAGVEAVAVSLLHGYRSPAHEQAVAARLRERAPGLRVSLSSVVSGEIREYERTSTTVANAYVLGVVETYLKSLGDLLRAEGFAGQLLLMLSSGGTCTVETACEVPIRLVESGPAGGAAAAAHHARATNAPHVLAFDMGGTTAKICLIDGGEPQITREFEVARVWRFKRGSGLPLLVPVVEMIEIGAGGGSIAHVDRMGLPKVGPESAGSEPGPACYGRGGERPTVTDANLLLGYLDPGYFLGGAMPLDRRAAETAIRRHLAEPLGLSVTDAAWGMHAIVSENMANAALMHAVERGKEIAAYDLYAFGGAAPMHVCTLAERLGLRTAVVPPGAGVRSCFGFLASPLAFEVARSRGVSLDAMELDEIAALLDDLEAQARAPLALAGVGGTEVTVRRFVEMRYRGQGYEVEVPVPPGRPGPAWLRALVAAFEDVYRTYYRHVPSGLPMEAVTWRVRAQSPAPPLPPSPAPRSDRQSPKGERPVWIPAEGGFRRVAVWDRYGLPPGWRTPGPAVVEEIESTTIVTPAFDVGVDADLNLVLTPEGRVKPLASDPVFVEVAWSRLISVVEQEAQALLRTAFTNIVRESGDLSAGVFDLQGRMVAQAITGTPGHINSMALAVGHVLRGVPPSTLVPGDVLATNDPWLASGHLNDITVVTPVFHRGRLVGYTASTCHAMDIGGRGITVDALDCYEEGFLIPPCRIHAAGRPQQVLDLLAANVRAPEAVMGDIHAQVSGNAVGAHRLVETLEEFGLDDIEDLAAAILDRSEAGMRAAIAELPDGEYRGEMRLDGFEEPLVIRTRIEVRGDEMTVDYAGSSPASRRAINVVLNYTKAYTTYGVKCVVAPHVPNNAGSFRPVTITAPEGSLLNAVRPAPVASRHLIGLFLPDAVMGALARAVPDRVIAESSSCLWTLDVRGRDRAGHTFKEFVATGGGMGARPTKDGLNATQFPSTIRGVPAEIVETTSPLVIHRRALAPDSGGPGKYRGGLGMIVEFGVETDEDWLFTASFERARIPCQGLLGGHPGAAGRVETADGRPLAAKAQHWLRPGERVVLQTPGGGGFGEPSGRDPALVAADAAAGRIGDAGAGQRPAAQRA